MTTLKSPHKVYHGFLEIFVAFAMSFILLIHGYKENSSMTNISDPLELLAPFKTNPALDCIPTCSKEDRYGNTWTSCIDHVACNNLIPGSLGTAFWTCQSDAEMATPDVSNCTSKWMQTIKNRFNRTSNIRETVTLANELLEGCQISRMSDSSTQFYGTEIDAMITLLNTSIMNVTTRLNSSIRANQRQKDFEDLTDKTIQLDQCLIDTLEPWLDLNDHSNSSLLNKYKVSTKLMSVTEDIMLQLTNVVPTHNYCKKFIPSEDLLACVETLDRRKLDEGYEYEFPSSYGKNKEEAPVKVKLPSGWTRILAHDKVEIAVITLAVETLAKLLMGTGVFQVNQEENKRINARIVSLSVTSSIQNDSVPVGGRSKSVNFSNKGVEIEFRHIVEAWGEKPYNLPRRLHHGEKEKVAMGTAQCAYWDVRENMWKTNGCKLVKITRYESTCECSHLTTFAILMDVHRHVGKQKALEVLTYLLCPLSEISLLLSIIILSAVKDHSNRTRRIIHQHLSFCLLIGNGMILLVLDRHFFNMSDGFCTGMAIIAHYVYSCAFMWMLFEGVQLYRMVIHVFGSARSWMCHYGTVAYVCPLIIVTATAVVGHIMDERPYGGDHYCWLTGNYIWAFMLPVAVVVLMNSIILFVAMKTAYQLQHQRHHSRSSPVIVGNTIRSYMIHIKGCFSLTILLGITWIVGFFILLEGWYKIVAAYMFTILNASQGFMIFLSTFNSYVGKKVLFKKGKFPSNIPSISDSGTLQSTLPNKRDTCFNSQGRKEVTGL